MMNTIKDQITLTPYGGISNIAKLCNMPLSSVEKSIVHKRPYSFLLDNNKSILKNYRTKKFISDKNEMLNEADESIVSKLKETTLDDLETRYCCDKQTIPNEYYVTDVKNMNLKSEYGYSFKIPRLYSLSLPETIFERYLKNGPTIFTKNRKNQYPTSEFIQKNPDMYFTDEYTEEICMYDDDEDDDDDEYNDDEEDDDDYIDEQEEEDDDWDMDDEEYY